MNRPNRPVTGRIQNSVVPYPLGAWHFEGHIGSRLDRIAAARFTTEAAWNQLYPQTEDAFRLREDDRSHRPSGVWRGEFWGKYILGATAACRYYGSDELKGRIRGAIAGLLSTQDADGYIGTYHDSAFFGPRTWNIWCRKYTLWGLLDAAELLDDDTIIEAASGLADHLIGQVGPDAQEIIRTGQFNGLPSTSILKPIVDLYRATGEARYLRFAEYIVDQWGRHPDGPPDLLRKALEGNPIHTWFAAPEAWAKSYEFLSCVEGLIELYRVTGEPGYLTAARNIHRLVRDWERNPAGGVSFNDKFVGARFLANSVAEICDVVYWNRLSFQLYGLTGEAQYLDEIERALYNALLCGMCTDGFWGLRRFRLTHLHIPSHRHFLEGHQCCVDNAPRGLFQATQSAVFRDDAGVRIALYEAGRGRLELTSGRTLSLAIEGAFPDDSGVTIRVDPETPEAFRVALRLPFWSRSTAFHVNDIPVDVEPSAGWGSIEREWRTGDEIRITFDMHPRLEFFDPSVFPEDHPQARRHREEWARLAQIGEDNVPLPADRVRTLDVTDALPQQAMAMLFRGPVALARDIRLGDRDIFAPVPSAVLCDDNRQLTADAAPHGIRCAYRFGGGNEAAIRVCDFASAGNTWDTQSAFNAWIIQVRQESWSGRTIREGPDPLFAQRTRSRKERGLMSKTEHNGSNGWRQAAVDYARIMSQVKWTPHAQGMPIKGRGSFEQGKEYTGVPYSSVKSVGRYIGFDIYLKAFLAAVENPRSVLYTDNLASRVPNAAAYYGKVCSSYTSYALQCGIWYVSRLHGPDHRDGVRRVDPQSAQTAEAGDIIYTPPAKPSGGSHIEIVTGITRRGDGTVTHVRVEESYPPTTKTTTRNAATFNAHLAARNKELYRITDLNAWRKDNRADSLLFPNYEEDAKTPVINRVLLLDRGDWVPYYRDQPVRINVMNRDAQGVKRLVIQRGDTVIEDIGVDGPGVIERSFSSCGDYTAHCVMSDGSLSQACEFSVCDLGITAVPENVPVDEPWEIRFDSDNMDVIIAHLNSGVNSYAHRNVFVTEGDRQQGRVVIPADVVQSPGDWQIWLIGENRYGRLKQRRDVVAVERNGNGETD